jgi:hypothetical protein
MSQFAAVPRSTLELCSFGSGRIRSDSDLRQDQNPHTDGDDGERKLRGTIKEHPCTSFQKADL